MKLWNYIFITVGIMAFLYAAGWHIHNIPYFAFSLPLATK